MPHVVVEKVQKTLGGLLTLKEISLSAGERTVTGVLGPSGCGKSTLLNIVAGLMIPDTGGVYLDGKDVTGRTGQFSYMRQNDLLLPSRTVIDNVCIPLLLKGIPIKAARRQAAEYLAVFGLEGFESYYPAQLSGGMRQRAAMLRTYLISSDVWLLDEPFASLDAITRKKMQRWLIDVFGRLQPTIFFVTHDIDEALFLCDRIYVLTECPTEISLELEVPFCRPEHGLTIEDPGYNLLRNRILSSMSL